MNLRQKYPTGSCAIAPLGKLNTKTGSSKYFNIFDTWENEDTTWEIYEVQEMYTNSIEVQYRLVATSGNTPLQKEGKMVNFHTDQSQRYIGRWKNIGSVLQSELTKYVKENLPSHKVRAYTYK